MVLSAANINHRLCFIAGALAGSLGGLSFTLLGRWYVGLDSGEHGSLPLVEGDDLVELITDLEQMYHSSEKSFRFFYFKLRISAAQNFCCLVWKKVGSLFTYLYRAMLAPI